MMQVRWYGQSAFALSHDRSSVFIDPFDDVSELIARGRRFEYPRIEGVESNVLLVTHEHADHNGVGIVGGEPFTVRSTAGKFDSPIGEIVAIASEHDQAAGTQRGPNTIYVFSLGGIRVAHFGDFGQRILRKEQVTAIGAVDLLFLPVGGGPTINASEACELATQLGPRWLVPMHYRTRRMGFLDTLDRFRKSVGQTHDLARTEFDTGDIPAVDGFVAVVPAVP